MPFEITYNPKLNKEAGYVEIKDPQGPVNPDDPEDPRKPLRPQDRQTLLFLLFKLLYTLEGRDLMRRNKPGATGLTDAQKKELTDYFAASGVTGPDIQNALLEAHVQADKWTSAYNEGALQDPARMAAEKIYLQKMAFITWCLWEDCKGHEFSMGW